MAKPGDVLRTASLVTSHGGFVRAEEGHDLLVVFAGSAPVSDTPEALDVLWDVGFAPRAGIWRVTAEWAPGDEVQLHALYVARGATEAVRAAQRWAKAQTPVGARLALLAVSHAPLGQIDAAGELPETGRPIFGWAEWEHGPDLEGRIVQFETRVQGLPGS